MGKYGWVIDVDRLDNAQAVGVIGPRGVTRKMESRLRSGYGRIFRMLDDDGEVYYEGRIIGGDGFEPLDDYGTPNAGAVHIQYRRDGEWETL